MDTNDLPPEDQPLIDNIRMIVGGIATLVILAVPIILIRKLAKTVENSEKFKAVESALN